jgi:hypothetical protein
MNNHVDKFRQFAVRVGALAGFAVALAGGQALAADRDHTPCFFVTQWQGWKAPDENTIYLGVNLHDVYRVDLSSGSSTLMWPNVHLVSIHRGSNSICSAIDLQLSVADSNGFKVPLIAKKLTKLTPEEIAAIPKKYLPN